MPALPALLARALRQSLCHDVPSLEAKLRNGRLECLVLVSTPVALALGFSASSVHLGLKFVKDDVVNDV